MGLPAIALHGNGCVVRLAAERTHASTQGFICLRPVRRLANRARTGAAELGHIGSEAHLRRWLREQHREDYCEVHGCGFRG